MRRRGLTRDNQTGNISVRMHQHLPRSVGEPYGHQLIAKPVENCPCHIIVDRLAVRGHANHDRDAFEAVSRLSNKIERYQNTGPVRPRFIGQTRHPAPRAKPCAADVRTRRVNAASMQREVNTGRSARLPEIRRIYRQDRTAYGTIAAVAIREDWPQQGVFQICLSKHRGRGALTRSRMQGTGRLSASEPMDDPRSALSVFGVRCQRTYPGLPREPSARLRSNTRVGFPP